MSKTPSEPFLVETRYLKDYLDSAIVKWKKAKVDADSQKAGDDSLAASCYIDAFQSMRLFTFGELLK